MDLDVECLASLLPLNSCSGVLIPTMSSDFAFTHNVPNAWLASQPNHPFWIMLLKKIQDESEALKDDVEALTGPHQLFKSLQAFNQTSYSESKHGPIRYMEPSNLSFIQI